MTTEKGSSQTGDTPDGESISGRATKFVSGQDSHIRQWQERCGKWVDDRFPDDTMLHRGLILGEESGEVQRCILKASQQIRGGADHWDAELRKEIADVFFTLASMAHRAGIDLNDAIWDRWVELETRTYDTTIQGVSSHPDATDAKGGSKP